VAEFPRQPSQIVRQFITEEADARLAKYRPLPPDVPPPPPEAPPHPTLPPDVVDAPLVRLFNFLRMC
jgi:mediator of RNA polymerase II transcription subunit 14